MSKQYKKPCSNCGNAIFMSDVSGKWQAYDDATTATLPL